MKHRVFVVGDPMGLLTKMMCEQRSKRDFLCAGTIEDASIVVGDEDSFKELRAQNKYAQIVTSEWLEAFDADESKPEPSAHACNANPAKFLKNVVVQLLVSHPSCRWGSVFAALIKHVGGRIAGPGEKATVAVLVEDGNSGSSGGAQSNIPVVSSLWLEESFRSKQRLPLDDYAVCADKENTQHRLASSSALAPPPKDPAPPTYETASTASLSVGTVDISPRLLGKKRELLRSISEGLLSLQGKSFTGRLTVRDFATESEVQELRAKFDFVVGEWYLICSHIARRFLAIPAERALSTAQARLQSLVFKPPRLPDGIAGFECFVFSCSSFSSTVTHDIARAVSVAGSLFLSDLASSVTTHLVVSAEESSQMSAKKEKATSCPLIKIVSLDWLVECLAGWKHIDEEQFHAAPSSQTSGGGGGGGASQNEDFYDATQCSANATQNRAPTSHSSQCKATPSLISPVPLSLQQQQQQQQDEEEMQVKEQEQENLPVETENEAKEKVEMCEGVIEEPSTPMAADCKAQESKKIFLLSCADSERDQLVRSIDELGGEVIGLPGGTIFETDCTHFLTSNHGEMKRTEKLLCAVASGKVVVKHMYLEECVKAGRWLDEADFLYVGQQWFPAGISAKWGNQNPFADMRALVLNVKTSGPPSDVLVRVISSGGGKAVLSSDAAAQELLNPGPTIVFLRKEDLGALDAISGGAPGCICVDPRWVVDFLSLPDVGTFSSPEYVVSVPRPEPEPEPKAKAKAPTKKRKSRG